MIESGSESSRAKSKQVGSEQMARSPGETDLPLVRPRVHTLPKLALTRVSTPPIAGTAPVEYQCKGHRVKYWREPIKPSASRWTTFRSFPLVLDGEGAPWAPACLWLMDKAQSKPASTDSLKPVAQDLCAYRSFLEDAALDWDDFSSVEKYARPTYLYRNHLNELVNSGELKKSTAARRMNNVIGFYRFLMRNSRMNFNPANDPWVEKELGIAYRDNKGFRQVASVTTTDISIKNTRYEDAWDPAISDGGKLRPLPVEEQKAVVAALKALGNIEYELMHYIALVTGAREATVLTLRLRDFARPMEQITTWSHKVRCGPGTGIDTKNDATDVYLSLPKALYGRLHAYAVSERARGRRARSALGEDPLNYLFLTRLAQPYYESKDDRNAVRVSTDELSRTTQNGWPLRKFIAEKVIPEVRRANPAMAKFSYRFHDLRATFGMNWVDYQMRQATEEGVDFSTRYLYARDQLRKLMWHRQATTTDKYLEYRHHMHHLQLAQEGWSQHLTDLIEGTVA
jgi:hypothetical protein